MSPLAAFITRRMLQSIPLLFVVIVISFTLIHTAPGDPTYFLVGEISNEEFIRAVRARFGLDRPLYEQFLVYISNVARGDLGYSLLKSQSVTSLILARIPATIILVATSMLLAVLAGIILGVISSTRKGIAGVLASLVSLVGVSVPTFWFGQILLLLLAVRLDLFPISGMTDIRAQYSGLAYLWDLAYHLVLPAITLASFNIAFITKLTRVSMLEALAEDYVTTARSKGLHERTIVVRHALRNALLPVTTYTGLTIGVLLAGAILTETVFSWPGMGSLLYDSLRLRDYPVMLGIFIYVSVIVVAANLVVDILYGILDPRIRTR